MNTKLFAPLTKISPTVWQIMCLIASIILYIAIIENRSPNFLRSLSISLRTSFGVMILITTLVIYLIYRIPGPLGQLAGMISTLSLFAMPLAGLWASGQTQSIMISGLIPVSDATNYYIDALRILNGFGISNFSAMRPIFPGFLSFLLSITNRNLMSALGVLTALMGVAAYIASREIQRTHGTEPAIVFLMCMFLYFRHHSGTTMSESLGLIMSLLGITLIWQGKYLNKQWLFLFGIITTTVALNIRPGAMFILPAFLLWGGWYFRGNKIISIKFILTGAALIASVFYINNLLINILAGPNNVAFANFSWAFYGLASGGNSWNYIFQAHPEVFSLEIHEQNRAIYKLAIDLIIQNPSLIAMGAFKYWGMFFSSTWYNAFSFIAGDNYFINEAARWSMYFLCSLGIIKWFTDRKDEYASLIALAALGILASVPFVPPTDAYRVRLYAATIPIFGLLPAMGVSYLRDRLNPGIFPKSMPDMLKTNFASQFCALLLIILLTAPVFLKMNAQTPILENATCPQGMDMVTIRYDSGTYVNVTRENVVFIDWMPNFHISNFRRNTHSLAETKFIEIMASVNPPSTLFYALDFQTNSEALVIIKTDELPMPGQFLSVCGQWDNSSTIGNYGIFHADFLAEK